MKQKSQWPEVYIVDGYRTPFLKAKTTQGPFSAADLALDAARALLLRLNVSPGIIDEVIVGCTMASGEEANIGKIIAIRLGCKVTTPGWTVQRNCASSLQSVDNAFNDIRLGRARVVLCGGTEAMSRAPLVWQGKLVNIFGKFSTAKTLPMRLMALSKFRPADLKPVIALLQGLTDPTNNMNMGHTAEKLASEWGITREMMDKFAAESHQRVLKSVAAGHYDEIIPIYDRKGTLYQADDGVRDDSTPERLAKLKPVFDRPFGLVTAGNSSQITDGAAMLMLASGEAVREYQLPVIGKIVDCQWSGVDPSIMGIGPTHSIAELLRAQQMALEEIDYFEINEAFAGQVLACLAALNDTEYCKTHFGMQKAVGCIPQNRLNIDGGAIAIGHPVGASGARLVLHMANTLKRQKAKRGIASLCIGGGQGGAMLIEHTEGV